MMNMKHPLQDTALIYFLEVAKTGSITAAAEELDVASSAISRQIARLEKELDTLLFDRRSRGMVPNAAGELLVAHARKTQQDIDRVINDVQALKGIRSGKIRIVTTVGFMNYFLPDLIIKFRKEYPGIIFELITAKASEVPQRIRDGEADIGITLALAPEEGIRVQFRHPSSIYVIVNPAHPLAKRHQLSLAEVVAYPLILMQKGSSLRQVFDICSSRQSLKFSPIVETDNIASLVGFVKNNEGISLCGELALRTLIRANELVAIPLRDREMNERDLEVQTLAGRTLSSSIQTFLRSLQKTITEE